MNTLLKTDKRTVKKLLLNVNEIFLSLQGEGSYSGMPTVFIRMTGCNLRCKWCDTKYAYEGKNWQSLDAILKTVRQYSTKMVSITGGEPLFHAEEALLILIHELHTMGKTVSLETNGSLSIEKIPEHVHIAMDLKAPSSGEENSNCHENLQYLKASDEIKIIIGDYNDFLWAQQVYDEYRLSSSALKIYLQPVFGKLSTQELAEWIIQSQYPFSLSVQLHKTSFGNQLK